MYTFPHYFLFPFSTDPDRYLFKVGQSSNDSWRRVMQQVRQTAMPEDPTILRVYKSDNAAELEDRFHGRLETDEQLRQVTRTGGIEWYATTLEYLDDLANDWALDIVKGPEAAANQE